MLTINEISDLKSKIIESMKILRHALYDDDGKLYDASYFGGGEVDRQNKLNLLKDYQSKLNDINNANPIYGTVACLKKKELSQQKKDEIENKRSVMMNLTIMGVPCPTVYSYIQYPDGEYHDTYVLYKGHSDEYNTDFICYYDATNPNTIMYTPVQIKDGQLMKNPNHTQEMINAFHKQFMEQQLQQRKMSFEQLMQEIPSIMGNTNVEQYETVPYNIVIGYNNPSKTQTQTSPLPPKKDTDYKKNDTMYHYRASEYGIDVIKALVAEIKTSNPGIDIFIESVSETHTKNNYLCNEFESYIVTMSTDINSIKFGTAYTKFGQPMTEDVVKKFFGERRLSNEDYHKIVNIVDSNAVLSYLETTYLDELRKVNPNVNIEIKQSNGKYLIICNPNKHLIKPEIKSPLDDQIIFDKKNVYEVTTKGQKFVRYRCNEKGEFIEERPYISADEVKQNDVTSVDDIPDLTKIPSTSSVDKPIKDMNQNVDTIQNSNVTNDSAENTMTSTHDNISSATSTVSEVNPSLEKSSGEDLSDIVARMMEVQRQTNLVLESYQKQMLAMQKQIDLISQQNMYLQQQLSNQNTMNNDIGKSM